jgi:NAD(P)-dependent dehydrogenase (short-subunit alcohol dehydrogenase family)
LPPQNKPVALVTGASRGIGRAIAIELANSHTVVATYRGNQAAAESLRAETGADIVQSDISSASDRAALVAHVKRISRVRIF